MKKLTALVILVSLSAAVQAQKAQLFKQKVLPNHTYNLTSKQGFDLEVIPLDSAALKAKDETGPTKSVVLKSVMESSALVKTSQATGAKNIPVMMTCNSITAKANINGQDFPIPPNNPAAGQSLNGQIDETGKVTVDTTTATDNVKAAVKSAIGDIPKQIKFPDKKLKVGDTFSQDESITDLNLPVGFDTDKEYMMKVIYTLTDIKDNLAYFDIKLELNIGYEKEVKGKLISLQGTGGGFGKTVFNLAKNYPQSVSRELNIAVNMKMPGSVIDTKVRISRDDQYTVAAN